MRFYRALLHLLPAAFRAEYGGEMRAIFARRRRDVSGVPALAGLWIATFFELLAGAAAVHWDILLQDLRHTARTLRRSPGFVLTAVPVVALGIGANTAAFSVTDFVLIRPLPYVEPERLVKVWEHPPGYARTELSPGNYRDWKRLNTVFRNMGASQPISVNMVGEGDPERLAGAAVTADLLPTLGVRPLLGRSFTAAEDRGGMAGTVLISHRLWQQELGGRTDVLGRRVMLDGAPFVVIGVMPPDFHYPNREAELWTPIRFTDDDYADRSDRRLEVVARLRAGVSIAQARAQMGVVAAQLARQYPKDNEQTGATVIGLRDELSDQSRLLLIALCGAALCVLLIACANLANLLLARALARRKELDVRAALGAGRERLARQLATESLALAVLGGALGVVVAHAALPLLARLVPSRLPIAAAPSIDLRVLVFAALLTGLTGIGFGMAPALRAGRGARFDGLRQGARTGGGRQERLRAALVIVEVTVSVVLLVSSGLLLRALWRVQAVDPGFRAAGVCTVRTVLPMPKYDATARRAAFYTRVLSGVAALPGVESAAYISFLPMVNTGGIWAVAIAGRPAELALADRASLRFVTPGFFATLRIPLRLGRDVGAADSADRPFVAVVSSSFAQRYWPGQDPLGRHFKVAFHDRVVAGVVGDIRVRGLERDSEPQVYLPHEQVPDGWLAYYAPKDMVIRSKASFSALLPAVRRIVRAADPEQPLSDARTMDDVVGAETAPRAVQLRVLAAFAAIAFLLAAIGIHGLLSFAVSQRTGEIGVRIALGAHSRDILGMVLRQGVLLGLAGVLPGVALAYGAGVAMASLLAGVRPGDTATFLAAVGLCLVMTASGSLLPAHRAARVDPAAIIRKE